MNKTKDIAIVKCTKKKWRIKSKQYFIYTCEKRESIEARVAVQSHYSIQTRSILSNTRSQLAKARNRKQLYVLSDGYASKFGPDMAKG